MSDFETKHLPARRDVAAPDGSDVRILLGLKGGGMAHFTLAPGAVSTAVEHRTIEEIWYCVAGRGEIWRRQGARESVEALAPGVCVTIPLGTRFQFRAAAPQPRDDRLEPLAIVAITMPPWPGEGEAVPVPGKWPPTVP